MFAALASLKDDGGSEEESTSGSEGDVVVRAPTIITAGRPAITASKPRFSARIRLLRDSREVAAAASSAQLPTISAEPSDDDIFQWRVTLTAPEGRYHGVIFHAELSFPVDYPNKHFILE